MAKGVTHISGVGLTFTDVYDNRKCKVTNESDLNLTSGPLADLNKLEMWHKMTELNQFWLNVFSSQIAPLP